MIILYSGGLDSTVLLYEFAPNIKLAVSFDYLSKHNDREYKFAQYNSEKLNIELIKIDLPFIDQYFKSNLLRRGGAIPEGHYTDESMKSTVIPFRNGIMLSIACGLAESFGIKKALIANHSGDHAIYPDCRPEFINSMSNAMKSGTYAGIEIFAPYTGLTKKQIALKGNKIGVDFSKTWSCYKGLEKHCGKCGSCVERKEALQGFDSTEYFE